MSQKEINEFFKTYPDATILQAGDRYYLKSARKQAEQYALKNKTTVVEITNKKDQKDGTK